MVRHEWHQVILKNHFAIVKIETSDLKIKIKIEDLFKLEGFYIKNNNDQHKYYFSLVCKKETYL